MFCTLPKVKGASGAGNICGGVLTNVGHTRPDSREVHTNWHCLRCQTRWTGEEMALIQMRSASKFIAVVKGPLADELNQLAIRMERILVQLQKPADATTLTADASDEGAPFH